MSLSSRYVRQGGFALIPLLVGLHGLSNARDGEIEADDVEWCAQWADFG